MAHTTATSSSSSSSAVGWVELLLLARFKAFKRRSIVEAGSPAVERNTPCSRLIVVDRDSVGDGGGREGL